MKVNILQLTINTSVKLKLSHAEKIRGYLGRLFWESPYAHGHRPDGRLLYRYPYVQYKVISDSCVLIGFHEGAEIVKKAFNELKTINIDGEWKDILSKGLESYSTSFCISNNQIPYTFLTPWLALNEKNYEKYQKYGAWAKRKELLEKILIGNIISMSKGLGYTVPEPIKAEIHGLKETQTFLKGTPMLGFLGTFSVNFEIPDYWGIGKSVSRGFGTVKRVRELKS